MPSRHGSRSSDSSPDPLAMSIDEYDTKTIRTTKSRDAMATSSPSKQSRKIAIPDIELSSPAKSMIMNTPRMGGASPWRIKVTVQAEPESNEENSPTIQRFTRTKTTTVPLKDPDVQTPAKRGRGRPRKSDVGTATKPKRKGTPVKRAPRSKSRDVSVGPDDSSAANIDTDEPPKRRRGRPRKSVQPPTEHDDVVPAQETEILHHSMRNEVYSGEQESVGSQSTKSTRFVTPDESDSDLEDDHHTPLPQSSTAHHVNSRRGTPHARKMALPSDLTEDDSDERDGTSTPHTEDEQVEIPDGDHNIPYHSEQISSGRPVRSPENSNNASHQTLQEEPFEILSSQESEDEDVQQDDVANFAFDEGTTRMPDDTTVLDSENFSMISVDSLPSGVGRSSPPKPDEGQQSSLRNIDPLLHAERLQPEADVIAALAPKFATSQIQNSTAEQVKVVSEPIRPTISRYKTPVVDTDVPSVPPAVEVPQTSAPKTETPKIGRVVTAGVALQGALEPSRVTPNNLRRDTMDDLFRGFSEGTRKELQAGLRLGEQLAEGHLSEEAAPAPSSPMKAPLDPGTKSGVFRTQRKYRQPRLLTPEDQDDYVLTPTEPATAPEVQYPTLNVDEVANPLLSPAESDNEMSWLVDTPPHQTNAQTNSSSGKDSVTDIEQAAVQNTEDPSKAATSTVIPHDDYADIWQEEASRTSNSPGPETSKASRSPKSHDLFIENGTTKQARGKAPRNWRRKPISHSQNNDETNPSQSSPQSPGEAPAIETLRHEEMDEGISDGSEASDDTGMFFQSNMPAVFNRKRSAELRERKADKQSLSSLLNQGESLLPDSSPPVITKTSPPTKINPFIATPPRFPGFPCSPSKSSPLRRELRGSDISSDSPRRVEDESTLPILQSSPFHTFVDGESRMSMASDQQQFRYEMEGSTSASIRQVRNEADEYLEAYEPLERSLDGITELTEPSRTCNGASALRSGPLRRQNFASHVPSPARKPTPVISATVQPDVQPVPSVSDHEAYSEEVTEDSSVDEHTPPSSRAASQQNMAMTSPEQDQQGTGVLNHITSTIASTLSRTPTPQVAPHPILSRLTPLPKVEPWTKTHYKALDKLYTTHLKHPALFTTSSRPATPLSTTNAQLLQKFLTANNKPYVGATYMAWGYSMQMTEELVVLCAVYMENMSLESIAEYEEKTGRAISMGDCGPGKAGDMIQGDDVLKRLATVVLGESVRRDEKMGKRIDRSKSLEIEWPQC